MNKELRRMAAVIKAVLWLNLVTGTIILCVGVHYQEWLIIANGLFFISFGSFVCPFMLRAVNGKS